MAAQTAAVATQVVPAVAQAASSGLTLTDWLALYAAGLSTLIALREFWKSRVSFELQLMLGIQPATPTTPPVLGLSVGITNTSSRPIFLGPVGLLTKERKVSVLDRIKFLIKYRRITRTQGWVHANLDQKGVEQDIPKRVEPGEYYVVFFPQSVVNDIVSGSATNIVRASTQSQFDINRYSNCMDLDSIKAPFLLNN